LENILNQLEKTEYFAIGKQERSRALWKCSKEDYERTEVLGDKGDHTRAFYLHLGRASLSGPRLIQHKKNNRFNGACGLSDIFPNTPFFKQLEGVWNLLMLVEPDFLKIVGNPLKREIILYKAVEPENALLWPDFHVEDISGYGAYSSQRVIEPTAVRYTYPTDNPDFPNVYFLLSPTSTQSLLAKKAIKYKPETINGFKPCTTF